MLYKPWRRWIEKDRPVPQQERPLRESDDDTTSAEVQDASLHPPDNAQQSADTVAKGPQVSTSNADMV